jgi:hypothetical protein
MHTRRTASPRLVFVALISTVVVAACDTGPSATPAVTQVVAAVPTVAIPTVTLPGGSDPTDPLVPAATDTVPSATETLPPSRTPTEAVPQITVTTGANVRGGPGTVYAVLGGLAAGTTVPLVGRDTSGRWFVINFAGAAGGQGWVADVVGVVSGDVSGLPVIAAPPTPRPTSTPIPTHTPPPTQTPVPSSSHGLTGQLTLCDPGKTTYAVNERICFRELIKNNTTAQVTYGILGVHAANLSGGPSQFQTSWLGNLAIDPGCFGPTDRCGGQWEDGVSLGAAGSYRLTMQICYSNVDTCRTTSGDWEVLTGGIVVQVV